MGHPLNETDLEAPALICKDTELALKRTIDPASIVFLFNRNP